MKAVLTMGLFAMLTTNGFLVAQEKPISLEEFRKMSPKERLKFATASKSMEAVKRGDLTPLLAERGYLDSLNVREIAAPKEATVKWLIDEGTRVKKGDKLIEFEVTIDLKKDEAVLRAATEGMIQFVAADSSRTGNLPQIEVGIKVRAGQKLLRVFGLDRLAVRTRFAEASVKQLRVGQAATIQVDAFPKRELSGKVKAIAGKAVKAEFQEVPLFPVVVELDTAPDGLKPQMSATVRIAGESKKGVLQAPVSAVVGRGKEWFCFMQIGDELVERKVTLGARNDKFVEILDGLAEDQKVYGQAASHAGRKPKR